MARNWQKIGNARWQECAIISHGFVDQVMKDASHAEPGAWTGANDILEEGNYTNIHDGTLFSSYGGYTYTSNYGCSFTPYQGRCTTENCLSIMYYVTFPFMIDDRGCESALYTLCKEKSYN